MSVPQWALEAGIKGIITDAEKDGKVQSTVDAFNLVLTGWAPGAAKDIRQKIVQNFIFPFCKLLLKEDASGYEEAKKGL